MLMSGWCEKWIFVKWKFWWEIAFWCLVISTSSISVSCKYLMLLETSNYEWWIKDENMKSNKMKHFLISTIFYPKVEGGTGSGEIFLKTKSILGKLPKFLNLFEIFLTSKSFINAIILFDTLRCVARQTFWEANRIQSESLVRTNAGYLHLCDQHDGWQGSKVVRMSNLQKAAKDGFEIRRFNWLWNGFISEALDLTWCCFTLRHQINVSNISLDNKSETKVFLSTLRDQKYL